LLDYYIWNSSVCQAKNYVFCDFLSVC